MGAYANDLAEPAVNADALICAACKVFALEQRDRWSNDN